MEGQTSQLLENVNLQKTEKITDKITRETAYTLYQTADPDTTSGYVSRPYTVGTNSWMLSVQELSVSKKL